MLRRTQFTLASETHLLARQRAKRLGVSFTEYLRGLVTGDLAANAVPNPSALFDLGSSAGSNIAKQKDAMVAQAFYALRKKSQRR
jgi:hypothetical protein